MVDEMCKIHAPGQHVAGCVNAADEFNTITPVTPSRRMLTADCSEGRVDQEIVPRQILIIGQGWIDPMRSEALVDADAT